jgi:hypothetical protein
MELISALDVSDYYVSTFDLSWLAEPEPFPRLPRTQRLYRSSAHGASEGGEAMILESISLLMDKRSSSSVS